MFFVTAHVLTEECEGETPMIPSDIMDYSISQSKKTDLSTTLQVMASPGQSIESIPGSDISTDPVVRCVQLNDSIQLLYGFERNSIFIVPRGTNYFPRRSRGK
jgi:hypothetical protein